MAVTVALVISACAGGDDGDRSTASFVGTDGAALYAQACSTCHGADLGGSEQGPPFLDAVYRPGHHADASFLVAVRSGARAHHWDFGDMPPVDGLSDEQVRAIVEYVREQQRAAGIE